MKKIKTVIPPNSIGGNKIEKKPENINAAV